MAKINNKDNEYKNIIFIKIFNNLINKLYNSNFNYFN